MCTLVTKGTTPTTVGFGFENHGVNFVKVESITEDGAFVPGKLMRISQAAHEALSRSKLHLISKKPQPTEEQAHVVSHPTASM
jgi:type I restriction enzyme S subunit